MKASKSGFDSRSAIRNLRFRITFLALSMIAARPSEAADTLDTPLNYFLYSYGPAATPVMHLGWLMTALLSAITLIVILLLVIAIVRKRSSADPDMIGAESGGLRWVYIGTGISTFILAGLTVYFLTVLNAVAKPTETPALTLTVTGYDWWWSIEYEHADPAKRFVTANEIHIPVGRPVLLKLKSADVIHAFWVPVLAGKTQMIPGLVNQKWIQADVPGIYVGQCAQFCGAAHAHMNLEVVAESDRDFEKWQEAQRRTAFPVSGHNEHGYKLFMDRCGGCHAVRGTEAKGLHGPDLTHLNSRGRIAAGLLTNTPDHLMEWITRAQYYKPGARMPSIALSDSEASALASYLSTLN
jgi:cytochrome c oxidase subunit 2